MSSTKEFNIITPIRATYKPFAGISFEILCGQCQKWVPYAIDKSVHLSEILPLEVWKNPIFSEEYLMRLYCTFCGEARAKSLQE